MADRLERNAAKREAKERGETLSTETDMSAYFGPPEDQPDQVAEDEEEDRD